MNVIAINTSQNVNLDFSVASLGDRILAFVIDWIVKISYLLFLFFIFNYVLPLDNIIRGWDSWSVMAFFGIILLPIELYTLVFESLMEGQTPGKKMAKIKVVKKDGYQAKFSDYLIRWFFRLVDVFLSSGFVGLMSMIFSPHNQRLGGIASGTAVISLKSKVGIDHTIIEDIDLSYQPRFQQVLALSDRDMQIIKTNYQNSLLRKDYQVISKLAQKIREISNIPDQRPDIQDIEFINIVIKDFNFYTGRDN
ncbi:RDD family protein [Weeksellaceae bacterium KMM 9713]|uniref:RDD family protein n=1 Tax=Profundicola chukchiensis TaxID=2961959 RepID=A0A9X4MZ27_9FLAO|nr:RDD family protein [Profundicola chukchiensis]MDG4945587.1 RDD family protein [Profundicola chukchiensis]